MRALIIKFIFGLFLLVLLFFVLNLFALFLDGKINVVSNEYISWGVGWQNAKSLYSGSELLLRVNKSSKISFQVSTSSDADQGIEVLIGDRKYYLSSPNLNSKELTVNLDKEKTNDIYVRHYCTYFYHPCDIQIHTVRVDRTARLLPAILDKKVLSILGDSISTIYGKDNYSFLLADNLGYQLQNASILGSSLSEIESSESAINRYQDDLKSVESDLIIVFLGSNDAAKKIPLDVFRDDYTTIVNDLKKWNPTSKIFLTGILPRKDLNPTDLENYSQIIKSLADLVGVYYIDVNNLLADTDFADEIHPSKESQIKLSDVFEDAILSTK